MATPADRFEAKVDRSGEHHIWLGASSISGSGQVRVKGKLRTATRVAWELANGPLPERARVQSCPDEPRCVRPEHLNITEAATTPKAIRSDRGAGSIREVGENRWKLTIDVGRDQGGVRRRVSRTIPNRFDPSRPAHTHRHRLRVR